MNQDSLAALPGFISALQERLEYGSHAYGESSFTRPLPELVEELSQEALDLAGWGFILWQRLEALKAKAAAIEGTR